MNPTTPEKDKSSQASEQEFNPRKVAEELMASAEAQKLPVLSDEQIEEVAKEVRKKLRQKASLAQHQEQMRKEKEVRSRGKVLFDDGMEGVLTVAGKGTPDLSFFDFLVNGRKFGCSDKDKELLEEFIADISGEEIDVTFLHTADIKIETVKKGRRKQIVPKQDSGKSDTVWYNCTVKVPKRYAMLAYEDKRMRAEQVAKILADIAYREWKDEQEKQQSRASGSESEGMRRTESSDAL